jgi:hypothetical protein
MYLIRRLSLEILSVLILSHRSHLRLLVQYALSKICVTRTAAIQSSSCGRRSLVKLLLLVIVPLVGRILCAGDACV